MNRKTTFAAAALLLGTVGAFAQQPATPTVANEAFVKRMSEIGALLNPSDPKH